MDRTADADNTKPYCLYFAVPLHTCSCSTNLLFKYPFEDSASNESDYVDEVTGHLRQQLIADEEVEEEEQTLSDAIIGDMLCLSEADVLVPLNLRIDNRLYVGYPTILAADENELAIKTFRDHLDADHDSCEEPADVTRGFTVVFVLPPSAPAHIVSAYQHLSRLIAGAIGFEDSRIHYLQKQCRFMDQCHERVDQAPEAEGLLRETAYREMLDSQDYRLASELACIFDKVSSDGCIQHYFNDWILLSFRVPSDRNALQSTKPQLRPYHGAILTQEPSHILNSLPLDTSPAIARVINHVRPTSDLRKLSQDTDLQPAQVYKVISHLVEWNCAKLIYPISDNNEYCLSNQAGVKLRDADLRSEFSRRFSARLLDVLQALQLPRRAWELTCDAALGVTGVCDDGDEHGMVAWLLSHSFIVQNHVYVDVCISTQHQQEAKRSVSVELRQKLMEQLSEPEFCNVLSVDASDHDLAAFAKLCKYFRENSNLEEIMYYENVDRTELLRIISVFSDVLRTYVLLDQN